MLVRERANSNQNRRQTTFIAKGTVSRLIDKFNSTNPDSEWIAQEQVSRIYDVHPSASRPQVVTFEALSRMVSKWQKLSSIVKKRRNLRYPLSEDSVTLEVIEESQLYHGSDVNVKVLPFSPTSDADLGVSSPLSTSNQESDISPHSPTEPEHVKEAGIPAAMSTSDKQTQECSSKQTQPELVDQLLKPYDSYIKEVSEESQVYELMVTDDALKVGLCETEALLRYRVVDAFTFHKLKSMVEKSFMFMLKLDSLAKEHNTLQGTIFQEVLASLSSGSKGKGRRSVRVPGRVQLPPALMVELRTSVEELISLVRIKVEDDKDIALARNALKECLVILDGVIGYAKRDNLDIYTAVQILRRW